MGDRWSLGREGRGKKTEGQSLLFFLIHKKERGGTITGWDRHKRGKGRLLFFFLFFGVPATKEGSHWWLGDEAKRRRFLQV